MGQTVSDYLLERLKDWGVDTVFAYPGDGINGLLAAWQRMPEPLKFVQARHEEMAAFEAVGYAKFSGRVGVCMATSGPGAIHLLNGLYDAKLDHVPVVAIVGQTNRSAMGGHYQQEVDLLSLFKDVAGDFVQMLTVPEQLPNLVDRAIRIALGRSTVTAIIVPYDVQELDYTPPTHAFKMVTSSLGVEWPTAVPDDSVLRRAADILNAGERVALLVGQGAREARAEVEQVADILGAGVAKALLGKDVLSDELPYVTGSIGLLGTRPSYELMTGCDTLLTVGSSFPYTQFLPEPGQARGVQIDVDPAMVGLRYPNELNLVGDAAATLRALIPLLTRREDRSWREAVEANVARWWESMEAEAMTEADPVNPMRVFFEASSRLPEDTIVAADSGSAANWYARQIKMRGRMRGSLSGNLATMGPAVPYGIGAKFAHPDRPVVVFEGDGAMQMNGLAERITIQRYWREWADPRLVVVVLHNDDLNQVTWEMRAMEGIPRFEESQSLPDVDYAAFARSLGLAGVSIDRPDQLATAWDDALSAQVPTVLDVRTDPAVPPIPPHATFEQAKNAAMAVLKGDDDRWDMVKEGVRTKLHQPAEHRPLTVPAVERVDVSTYTIPTDAPEGDGTLLWDSTTVVVVQARVGATVGTGWTYGPPAVGAVVASELAPLVVSTDPMDIGGTVAHLRRQTRNMTRSGVVGYAISAVDVALWDLKARLLDLPLHHLLGAVRRSVPVYGSGGFVTYDEGQLRDQLSGWVAAQRIPRVKIKIGQDWGARTERDLARIGEARSIIGPDVELYVDANGAYTAKQAIRLMADAAEANVTWLEEPVSSQDLAGLREVRRAVTADVAAGEYVPDVYEARRLCAAGAVDCLLLDASRCGGITEFLRGAAVAASYGLDVSAHCGPHLHAAVCASVPNARHIEWFHDHVRIESMLFDGTLDPAGGSIAPRDDRAGHGLQLRADQAREWLAGPPQLVTSPAT